MSTIDRERSISTAELIRAWVTGWAAARSVPAPVEAAGGFRLDVGLPEHRVRYVLHDVGHVAETARTRTDPGTWIKSFGPPERIGPELTPAWTIGDPEYVMTGPLRQAAVVPPSGYTIEVEPVGAVVFVRLLAGDGAVAASGRIGVTGETAVADQIRTDPAHRRRGLGSVLMTALGDAAAERGARTGVLVATPAGRALYTRLGWTLYGVLTPAWIPEPAIAPEAGVPAAEPSLASSPVQARPAR
ncbi:GNAT family N-acetyltransferase [Embleya sp. NPDC127516]|uniref:GNAT family N-acetyltransferase n=1 Tax=Embleya sp. NPDC127516 TaxID=3363990 RepID=UPI0037F5FDE6